MQRQNLRGCVERGELHQIQMRFKKLRTRYVNVRDLQEETPAQMFAFKLLLWLLLLIIIIIINIINIVFAKIEDEDTEMDSAGRDLSPNLLGIEMHSHNVTFKIARRAPATWAILNVTLCMTGSQVYCFQKCVDSLNETLVRILCCCDFSFPSFVIIFISLLLCNHSHNHHHHYIQYHY